jgi:HEAT repeat protein
VINGFDGANISSLDLDAIASACADAIPVLEELLAQGDRAARWAALVALAAVGHECNAAGAVLPHLKTALNDLVKDPDISMRVTAAELVTSFGDKAGIPVLIDAVDSDVPNLRPAEPPTSVCTQAISVLGHYLGQTFIEEADWQAWWDANQDSLEWDPDNERFS